MLEAELNDVFYTIRFVRFVVSTDSLNSGSTLRSAIFMLRTRAHFNSRAFCMLFEISNEQEYKKVRAVVYFLYNRFMVEKCSANNLTSFITSSLFISDHAITRLTSTDLVTFSPSFKNRFNFSESSMCSCSSSAIASKSQFGSGSAVHLSKAYLEEHLVPQG